MRRSQLVAMLTEKNRRANSPKVIHKSIDEHIRWLEKRLSGIDDELAGLVRETPIWRERDELLRSVEPVYARARELCAQIRDPALTFSALFGQWVMRWWKLEPDKVMELVDEILAVAEDAKEPAMLLSGNWARGTRQVAGSNRARKAIAQGARFTSFVSSPSATCCRSPQPSRRDPSCC
jgi:hypothetical protein